MAPHTRGTASRTRLSVVGAALAAAVFVSVVFATSASAAFQTFGVTATQYATGLPYNPGTLIGPLGATVDANGRLFVADGSVYRFDGPGDATNAAANGGQSTSAFIGLAFDSQGHLYVANRGCCGLANGDIEEINPSNGQTIKTIRPNLNCPTGLAADPLTGDLFFTESECAAPGSADDTVQRISNPQSVTPSPSTYASGMPNADGIAFAPDGTLYVTGHAGGDGVWQVAGTNTADRGHVTSLATDIPGTHLTVGRGPSGGRSLFINRKDGTLTRLDLAGGGETTLFTGGAGGEQLAFGPDGCLYTTQADITAQTGFVLRIANSDGSCLEPPLPTPASGGTTPPSPITTVGQTPIPAIVSNVGESNTTWREGSGALSIARRRAPVGTTFRFSLNKGAFVRFDFTQPAPGRKLGRACVAPNRHNKRKHRCTRTVVRGSFSFIGHAGVNRVRFQGVISRGTKLKPGRYTLVITAMTPGAGSTSKKLTFTIVR
jgi:hypothetical protein